MRNMSLPLAAANRLFFQWNILVAVTSIYLRFSVVVLASVDGTGVIVWIDSTWTWFPLLTA